VAVKINKSFEGLIKYLVEYEKEVAEAAKEQSKTKPRPWFNFNDNSLSTKPDPSLVVSAEKKTEEELHKVLDREESGLSQEYVDARSKDDSKSNEIAAPKVSGDFMAALSRDAREMWRGRIRMIAHADSRCAGNGQDNGPLRRHTLDFISRVFLKAEEDKKSDG